VFLHHVFARDVCDAMTFFLSRDARIICIIMRKKINGRITPQPADCLDYFAIVVDKKSACVINFFAHRDAFFESKIARKFSIHTHHFFMRA
jgi:hypothetical protein